MTFDDAVEKRKSLPPIVIYENQDFVPVVSPLNGEYFKNFTRFVWQNIKTQNSDFDAKLFSTNGDFCVMGSGICNGKLVFRNV